MHPHPHRILFLTLAFLAASAAAFSARSYSLSSALLAPKSKRGGALESPLDIADRGKSGTALAARIDGGDIDGVDIDPRSADSDAEAEEEPCTRRGFLRTAAAAGAAAAGAASILCAEPDGASAEGVGAEGKGDAGRSSNDPSSVAAAEAAASSNALLADATATAATAEFDLNAILKKSAKRALGGGSAGAAAAVVQVCTLMWLRTAMNYQYRYGGNLSSSLQTLYEEGGISRLYQGLPFALVQGPLTRFGDTAANVGVLVLLESIPETASLPLPLRTAAGSVAAGLWRIVLMPVDTSKTAMQVEGSAGLDNLVKRVTEQGPGPLYQGALASAAATAAGHYPWFLTYNALNDYLPAVSKEEVLVLLVRSAFLGLAASCVSDCVSNSLRVVKTTKQTAGLGGGGDDKGEEGGDLLGDKGSSDGGGKAKEITYREALALILEQDGIKGLFGRGLKTRLLTNAIQGAAFSVLWKYFQTLQQ